MKIPYGKHWISEEDQKKVLEVMQSDFLTTGPLIPKFEAAFAKYVGAKYAIAVSSGTAALHIAAQALGINSKTEIITTPMSFAATSNCVLYNDGTPVFSDITKRGLLAPDEIADKMTTRTAGIIPVDYMGLPCALKDFHETAQENGLFVLEDASHALGAKYENTKIGNCAFSDATVFSLHPVKHITTGEGGIITTNDEELSNKLRLLRTHGITKDQSEFSTNHKEPWYQEMQYLGFNYRLTDIQAALGLSQLLRINQFVERRREIAKLYIDSFSPLSENIETIPEEPGEFHSYHLFVVKVADSKTRWQLFDYLKKQGIFCQVHYIPIYWHPYYREHGFRDMRLPNAEEFYERILSLPMFPALSDSELDFVISAVKSFFHT
jgi:perosamine synthetase